MKLSILCASVAGVAVTVGCAGSFDLIHRSRAPIVASSSSVPDCAGIDNDRMLFSALAKGAGVLAGTSGLTIIPVDDNNARIGLAIGAAVAGAGAVVFQVLSDQKGAKWVLQCGP